LAHLLAGVCWFTLPVDSFGSNCLFSYAVANQSRPDTAEKGVRMIRRENHCVARSATKNHARTRPHPESLREKSRFCGLMFAPSAIIFASSSEKPIHLWLKTGGTR
jgi:hypothetical protein